MLVPMRLYRRTRDGAIVETLEPGETGALLYGQGTVLVESVAEVSGVAAYLRQRTAMSKAVQQREVEDKAVDQGEVEDKSFDGPQDRARGRRSGAA